MQLRDNRIRELSQQLNAKEQEIRRTEEERRKKLRAKEQQIDTLKERNNRLEEELRGKEGKIGQYEAAKNQWNRVES